MSHDETLPGDPSLTVLLERHRAGDAGAMDAVWPIVYAELKRIAQRQISGERPMTLTPTDLLHEACIKIFGADVPIASRRHLFALAARVMRNVLVDHARAKKSLKRCAARSTCGKPAGFVTCCRSKPGLCLDGTCLGTEPPLVCMTDLECPALSHCSVKRDADTCLASGGTPGTGSCCGACAP